MQHFEPSHPRSFSSEAGASDGPWQWLAATVLVATGVEPASAQWFDATNHATIATRAAVALKTREPGGCFTAYLVSAEGVAFNFYLAGLVCRRTRPPPAIEMATTC